MLGRCLSPSDARFYACLPALLAHQPLCCRYLDYALGLGPQILGHGHPEVLAAIHAQGARPPCRDAPPAKSVPASAHHAAGLQLLPQIGSADQLGVTHCSCSSAKHASRVLRQPVRCSGRWLLVWHPLRP